MNQRTFFGDWSQRELTPNQLARSSHPDTSHKAAAEIVDSGKLQHAMKTAEQWLRQMPHSTASELEEASGLTDGKIRKRLNDLKKVGLAEKGEKRRCRVTGRMAYTWIPSNKP